MYRQFLFLFAFCLGFSFCSRAQFNWKLKSDRDSIYIFTSPVPGSSIKALKIETTAYASLAQLVAVILDIKSYPQWVYSTKSCLLVKTVSPSELYYYSEVNFPWPSSNRDFVSHISVFQDPNSKTVTIDAVNADPAESVPVKPGIVRIQKSIGKWTITPLQKKQLRVEYFLEVDPGGGLPAWIINLFFTKGPFETFKNLRLQLLKAEYQQVHFPFIAE